MPKLSYLLWVSAVLAMCLGIWSVTTIPIIKFGTETLVQGRVNELIDRSRLSEEEIESLDASLQRIVNNDKQWQDSHQLLHKISAGGFLLCAVCFLIGAVMARRLEERLSAAKNETM
jgi:hypothetical protein